MGVLTIRATGLREQVEAVSQFLKDAADSSDEVAILNESREYREKDNGCVTRFWRIKADTEELKKLIQ